jgi:[protein-PII] uridylyltransferase
LHTVQAIKAFDTPEQRSEEPLYAQLYHELEEPNLLLWAALLHDIGKGAPNGDHAQKGAEMAQHILKKLGLKENQIDTVSFLVREHLLLAKTATRRDIYDEETAISCARIIEDSERLKMLYLLTVADSQATGPKAWNNWTSTLLKSFFLSLQNIIERGELVSQGTVKIIENKKARILSTDFSPEIQTGLNGLMSVMSPRYLMYVPVKDMVNHIKLYYDLGDKNFVWDINRSDVLDTRTVTLCAKDHPGLFSKIAGIFTLNSINILHAQVFTWRNNIALDIFEVTPPPDQIFEAERWKKAEKDLASGLAGELNLGSALKDKLSDRLNIKHLTGLEPPRVNIDNKSSSYYTIIEVFTYDFPGLLFSITDALYQCELDIWIAKIATKIDQVVDVFYVRDYNGQKVDAPDKVAVIKEAVENVIGRG